MSVSAVIPCENRMSALNMVFSSTPHASECPIPPPGSATVRRISASSCGGTRPSIPFLFLGWGACVTDGFYDYIRRWFANRHRHGHFSGGSEIVSRYRDARNLLSDHALD